MIALSLIDLVDIEIELPTASPGDADPDLADRLASVPPPRQQQLRTGQIDTLIRRHVRQQLVERVRCRHCVVVQQPQPMRVFRRYGAEADGVGVILEIGSIQLQSRLYRVAESEFPVPVIDRIQYAMVVGTVQKRSGCILTLIVDCNQPSGSGIKLGQRLESGWQPTRRVEGDEDSCDVCSGDIDPMGLFVDVVCPGPWILIESVVLDVDRHESGPGARASWSVLVRTGQGDVAIHQILCNPRLPIGPPAPRKGAARLGGPLLYASRLSKRQGVSATQPAS